MRVYPRAKIIKDVQPVDVGCADRIIEAKEAGLSKAEAAGQCLNGSDDVAGFEKLWRRITRQSKKARLVDPAMFSTVVAYKAAVREAAPLLDDTKWYNGLKAETETESFDELKAKSAL